MKDVDIIAGLNSIVGKNYKSLTDEEWNAFNSAKDEIRENTILKKRLSGRCIYLSDESTTEYCVQSPCPNYKPVAGADEIKELEAKNAELNKNTEIKYILRILHSIGGCDATDEFSRGWDSAIDTAISAIQKKFNIRDFLDEEEPKSRRVACAKLKGSEQE